MSVDARRHGLKKFFKKAGRIASTVQTIQKAAKLIGVASAAAAV